MKADITAIILTKNEERNIADCINSIKDAVKRIVILDSFSDDKTIEICIGLGAEIYEHKFENYAKQYDYAVHIGEVHTDWILKFDADERMTAESREELVNLCNTYADSDINGIELRFKRIFMNKCLYHGGIYPWKKLSCYKTQYGHIENKEMDEHIVITGKKVSMKHDCLHLDNYTLEEFVNKHNYYAAREANDYFNFYKNGNNKTYNLKDWIKCNLYYRLPLGFRAHLYYIYRYYFCLGFLDGKEGKIYAFMQAYWYRFLVDAKIYEKQKKL